MKRLRLPSALPSFLLAAVLASCETRPVFAQEAQSAAKPAAKPIDQKTVAPPPVLTDGQHEAARLRLREPQQQFFMAQKDMQIALETFTLICNDIAHAEGWPAGTQCNINNLAVAFPPPEPAKAETPPKPDPTK